MTNGESDYVVRLPVCLSKSATSFSQKFLKHDQLRSSPAPKSGRYLKILPPRPANSAFQSSPAPKSGRYSLQPPCPSDTPCFNPRPPRRVGATVRDLSACFLSLLFEPGANPDHTRAPTPDSFVSESLKVLLLPTLYSSRHSTLFFHHS